MMDPVEITLREWRRTPFIYGQSDCMLSIGHYIALCGGRDVTGQFIGQYDDHEGALEAMAAHGGFAGLMILAGVEPVDGEPQRGDIIALGYGDDAIGALCTGGMAAARLERGVVEVSLKAVRVTGVWRGSC